MRWYFAIDEGGSNTGIGLHARLAVLTANMAGGLEPCLLYYGAETEFTGWMRQHGVKIIPAVPRFIDAIHAAEAAGTFHAYSIGHWLRIGIPLVETENEFVLYTDCDVVFLRAFDWSQFRPRIFQAAPEFKKDNWNYFNSGVMLLNVAAMRSTYEEFETHIRTRIGHTGTLNYDDQWALNEAYRGYWEKLDPSLNWKPYWGYSSHAAILHFHGPKLDTIEAVAAGTMQRDNPTAIQLANMLDGNIDAYLQWLNNVADLLQSTSMVQSLRLQTAASALVRYRNTTPRKTVDTSFMNINLFAES
jgi:hypothetical protein